MINDRITNLRNLMKKNGIDAYIINSTDPHLSEYVAQRWQSRKWISGFTGSAGTVIITSDFAGLWTDGRYFIQAEKQIAQTEITLFKLFQENVPIPSEWIYENLENQSVVGFDGKMFSAEEVKKMKKRFDEKKITLKTDIDLINEIWVDRPAIPASALQDHSIELSGKSRTQKIQGIREHMSKNKANVVIISSLDEIAWTFNIRANDVVYNPVAIAFAAIEIDKIYLFIDENRVDDKLSSQFGKDGITIHEYSSIYNYLKKLSVNSVIQFAPMKTNYKISSIIKERYKIKEDNYLISKMKAKKNNTEINNLRNALILDCTALTKFIIWLKTNIENLKINEYEAAEKLLEFRKTDLEFIDASFESISAYGINAAMMHYTAKKNGSTNLIAKGFYLIDSGGQYKKGTTDITRTIVLGTLSKEQRINYTLVLKGVIDLSCAKFLEGTTGANLDILARSPLWKEGIDYKCGTGHGVGSFLSVHEGHQNFSQVLINVAFEPGMVTTVEPGVYLENRYGIRTENMLLTIADKETEFGKWLKFETLSFCPIDKDAIVIEILSDEQLDWLNNYHQQVYANISPNLNLEEQQILKNMTAKLVK